MWTSGLKRSEWEVIQASLKEAQEMVRLLHYTRGGSNTATDIHGLVRKNCREQVLGFAWYLPPTRVAAESVHEDWKRVVSLTRLVLNPFVPKNGASFLLSRSVRMLRRSQRYSALVTYADESQGHTGAIYKAANFTYVGRTGPYPKWVDPVSGRQVAVKSTKNRTKATMESLGYICIGSFYKHKFVILFEPRNPFFLLP